MKKTKLQKHCNIIEEKIKEQTGWNKARIYIIVAMIIAIVKLERVNLKKISKLINPKETKEANYRRLSRFFQKFKFDKSTMAKLMSSFLPKEKFILSMDRTNWKFGKVHINILMLSVAYKGMAIPIIWYLLKKKSKQGNSGYRDRIRIIKKFIDVFGLDRIEVLVADREFVGEVWFRWLKKRNIPFAIRVMNNKHIKMGRGNVRIDSLFSNLKLGEHTFYKTKKTIYGYQGLLIIALKMKDEYLILATNIKQEMALGYYKRRWEIEMLFSAFKKRGFNLEETHMSANNKIDSLIAVLSLTFAWSHSIGEWLNEKKPIKLLKHGYMAQS
ncbi:MAG: IS4 family transposase, partial [Sulfurovaceae bacterium]|nr:IS4 family transposase [Sulfurovaceae bacterium]